MFKPFSQTLGFVLSILPAKHCTCISSWLSGNHSFLYKRMKNVCRRCTSEESAQANTRILYCFCEMNQSYISKDSAQATFRELLVHAKQFLKVCITKLCHNSMLFYEMIITSDCTAMEANNVWVIQCLCQSLCFLIKNVICHGLWQHSY